VSVATQKSPLVAIVRLLVRGQMGQFLLPEEQVLPVSARPSRGRGLGNRRQVLHEWGPLAGHQWGFLHGHVHAVTMSSLCQLWRALTLSIRRGIDRLAGGSWRGDSGREAAPRRGVTMQPHLASPIGAVARSRQPACGAVWPSAPRLCAHTSRARIVRCHDERAIVLRMVKRLARRPLRAAARRLLTRAEEAARCARR
jgi:hypothetical protein